MKPHNFDGMMCGDANGNLVRVFTPRWWQVVRWLWWAWSKWRGTITTGEVEILIRRSEVVTMRDGSVRMHDGSETFNVRVYGEAKRSASGEDG